MTVLSKAELVSRLAARNLVVSPIIHKDQLQPAAIDLRMGNTVLLVRSRGLSHVDPAHYRKGAAPDHKNLQGKQQKLETFATPFDKPFLLHPGTLALVPTMEWVRLPSDITGVVTARSSWAREGLNIATANFINPNFKGIITLELANFGEIPIMLYPGLRIAQIAFYAVGRHKAGIKEAIPQSQFDAQFEPTPGNLVDETVDPFVPATPNPKIQPSIEVSFPGKQG